MDSKFRSVAPAVGAGLLWAVVYALVWGVAWLGFMRSAWHTALAEGNRELPWTNIWSVWAILNVPLGLATASYLGHRERIAPSARGIVAIVLVLWVPMTVGMFGWAWYESMSLTLIALDSAVNLLGLAAATWIARQVIRQAWHRRAA